MNITKALCALVLMATPSLYAADVLFKATVDPTFVLLSWNEVKGSEGFDIYRKSAGGDYVKLNARAILPLTNCVQIEGLIPPHSAEAKAVAAILRVKPCDINGDSLAGRAGWTRAREALALRYYRVAEVRGLAYRDEAVTPGQTYFYTLKSAGREGGRILATGLEVRAGSRLLLPAPGAPSAQAGDAQVFVAWNPVTAAVSYQVVRAVAPAGPFLPITPAGGVSGSYAYNPISADSMTPPKPGFLDTNCTNNTTYYYKILAIDLLGGLGNESATVSATPRDITPPMAPSGIMVQPLTLGLQLTWTRVDADVTGRPEKVLGYSISRYGNYHTASKDTLGLVAGYVSQPDTGVTNVNFKDTLITPNATHWYRIRCEDNAIPAHNMSAKSAAVSGFYKDPYPPSPPGGLTTDAFEDSIQLRWSPPGDGDLAGFNIYRGICGCETVYVYQRRDIKTAGMMTREFRKRAVVPKGWFFVDAYCRPYTLGLIANIDSAGARRYTDRTVPKGSPICYRYAMNAYDTSQNISAMSDSVCDRLKDHTGPTAPVLAGLQARDRAVLVQWVESPVQDLFGFVVDRAPDPTGPWTRVSPPLALPDPASIGCKSVSATNTWADSLFSFLDTAGVKPNVHYWYRVRAVDYLGNEGKSSPEIGTFTYDRNAPRQAVNLQTASGGPCIVTLTWDPGYDSSILGFAVFRSKSSSSGYFQVSPIVRGNTFNDPLVVSGETYYYRVQSVTKSGNRSAPSASKSFRVP